MRKINKIIFGFEDSIEALEIQIDLIEDLSIEKISRNISLITDTAIEYLTTEYMAIFINKEANTIYDPFGINDSEEDDETVFERLTAWNDISYVELIYEDSNIDVISFENYIQKNRIDANGNLLIEIKGQK